MPKLEHRSDGDGLGERDVRRRRRDHHSDGEGDPKEDERERGRSPPRHRELEYEEEGSKRRRRDRGPEEKRRVQKPQGESEIGLDKHHSLPSDAQSYRAHAQGQISNTIDAKPSKFLVLHNIFDKSVEREKELYLQLREEVHTKCAVKGSVVHAIHVDRHNGSLCLQCDSTRSASQAKKIFEGQLFHDRMITCIYMTENVYNRRFGG